MKGSIEIRLDFKLSKAKRRKQEASKILMDFQLNSNEKRELEVQF